jgi:DNA repair exonuclease SbcCD ATPase subunit
MKKLITPVLLTVVMMGSQSLSGQQFLGNVQGNYNTTQAMIQNPAQVYPDRNRLYIHWWSYGAEFNNNHLRYAAPFSLWKWTAGNIPTNQQNRFGRVAWNNNWLEPFGNQNEKFFNYISTNQGLSFAFRVNQSHAFGFSTRTVQGISITGIQEPLAQIGRLGIQTAAGRFPGNGLSKNTPYQNGAFSINTDNYQEFNFTFGSTRGRKTEHLWKRGFTGRFLLGFGAAYAGGTNLNYRFEGRDSLFIDQASFRTAHSGTEAVLDALNNPLGIWFSEVNGVGFGFDYGFVYEYRPAKAGLRTRHRTDCWYENDRDYRLRLGASLRDVGMIAYFNGSARSAEVANQYWSVNRNLVNSYNPFGASSFEQLDTGFTDRLGSGVTKSDAFATFTPAALNVQFDYHMGAGWYLGANLNQNLRGKSGAGLRSMSQFSVIPRYEGEDVELGMPLSLTANYQRFALGLYGRLGPFLLGTDNLVGLAQMSTGGKMTGASLYGGFRFKINPCPWWVNTRTDLVTPITDTTIKRQDTIRAIQRDSIIKRDTVSIEKIKRDTVYITKSSSTISAEVKRKEQELLKKEEELKRREAAVIAKENQQPKNTGNCCEELAIVSGKLQQEQDRSARLQAQVNALNQDKISLNSQLNQCKTGTGSTVNAEVNRLKTENDNLKTANAKLQQDLTKCGENNSVLTAEVNTLKGKVSSLESQLAQCKAESSVSAEVVKTRTANDNLKNEIATLKARVSTLEGELAQCKAGSGGSSTITADINKLKSDNDLLRARNAQLEDALSKEKAANATITAEVNSLKKQLADQQNKLSILEAELQKCKSEGASAAITAEVNRLKKESDDCKSRVAVLEAELSKEKGTVSTLTAEINKLKKDNSDQVNKIAALEAELQKCKSTDASSTLTAEINKLKKDNSDQVNKIAALEAELQKCKSTDASSTLTAEINKLKKDNSDQVNKIAALEAELQKCKSTDASSTLTAEINKLKKDNSDQVNKIAALEAELQKCKSTDASSTLTAEINKLKSDNSTLKAKVSELEQKVAASQDCTDQLAALKQKNAELENQNKAIKAEYQFAMAENSKLKTQIADLENKLKNCDGEAAAKLEAEIVQLKQKNAELNAKAAQLEGENARLKQANSELEAKIKAADNNDAQDQLNLLKQEYDALRTQNNNNRDKARELEAQVNALKARISTLETQLEACQGNQNGGGNGQGMQRPQAPSGQRLGQAAEMLRRVSEEAARNRSENPRPTSGTSVRQPAANPAPASNQTRPAGSYNQEQNRPAQPATTVRQPAANPAPASNQTRPAGGSENSRPGQPGNPAPAEQRQAPTRPTMNGIGG